MDEIVPNVRWARLVLERQATLQQAALNAIERIDDEFVEVGDFGPVIRAQEESLANTAKSQVAAGMVSGWAHSRGLDIQPWLDAANAHNLFTDTADAARGHSDDLESQGRYEEANAVLAESVNAAHASYATVVDAALALLDELEGAPR